MKGLTRIFSMLMILVFITSAWLSQPQPVAARSVHKLTLTRAGHGCYVEIYVDGALVYDHLYEDWSCPWTGSIAGMVVDTVPEDTTSVVALDDKDLEYSKISQVSTVIQIKEDSNIWLFEPDQYALIEGYCPPLVPCPCPTYPTPGGPCDFWPLPFDVGQQHNAALDYFYKNEAPLTLRKDGNISMSEYERALKATTRYAVENINADISADDYINQSLKALEIMGLVNNDGVETYVTADLPEVFARQIAYLQEQDSISPHLADELAYINKMALNSTDGKQVTDYVTNEFANQKWDGKDAVWVALYVDVFSNSAKYWENVEIDDPAIASRRPPRWVIVAADALGGVAGGVMGGLVTGGNPVGIGVGAVAFGGACSGIIAATWKTASTNNLLTVTKTGNGAGNVSSTAAGIACGTDCTEDYALNTRVELNAIANSGSTFAGWGGACSGSGTCQVLMSQAQNVTATFTKASCYSYSAVFSSGVSDNFDTNSNNPESPSPSADFMQWWNTLGYAVPGIRAYDEFHANQWFAHTFSGLRSPGYFIQGATLETRIKNGDWNDNIALAFVDNGFSPLSDYSDYWELRLLQGLGIPVGQDATFTLDIGNLPASNTGLSGGYLLPLLNTHPELDVWVQDDSAIDYVNLTIDYGCDSAPSNPLIVTKTGTGIGKVTSAPVGIACGTDCTEDYASTHKSR